MRIGIDGRPLQKNRTGIGMYVHEILFELNKIDNKNEYYIYSAKEMYLDFKLNDNFKLCQYKGKIGTAWLYFKLPKILKKDGIDIFWGTCHCLPKRNRFTKDIKYVLTIHDIALKKFKKIGQLSNVIIHKLTLNKSCRNADKIISVSKSTKNDLIELMQIKENKITIAYPGIKQKNNLNITKETEERIEKKFNLKDGTNFIFFISTIEPRKNLDTAIKAFEIYKQQTNTDLKFVISGGEGWRCKKTLELIENSKYKSDIIKTGYINEYEKQFFFENCKCVVYPSLYEGFGLPVLEAMQYGTIIITSNISSLPEVGGEAALYLNNVLDSNELANLIRKAVELTDIERKSIVNKGFEQARKFSWAKCAQETKNILLL